MDFDAYLDYIRAHRAGNCVLLSSGAFCLRSYFAAQAAQRALFERRAAAAVGSTLEDLAVFYDQPLGGGEEGGEDELGLGSNARKKKAKGVLGQYLNAAKQAAEEAAKTRRAQAEKLIIARQQNLQHLSGRSDKDIRK